MMKGWRDVFQTGNKAEVEAELRETGQDFSWEGDNLRITSQQSAIEIHPLSGDKIWFNHTLVRERQNLSCRVPLVPTLSAGVPFHDALLRAASSLPASWRTEILVPLLVLPVCQVFLLCCPWTFQSWFPHFLWRRLGHSRGSSGAR